LAFLGRQDARERATDDRSFGSNHEVQIRDQEARYAKEVQVTREEAIHKIKSGAKVTVLSKGAANYAVVWIGAQLYQSEVHHTYEQAHALADVLRAEAAEVPAPTKETTQKHVSRYNALRSVTK
jgi:putative transposon-encoded protein